MKEKIGPSLSRTLGIMNLVLNLALGVLPMVFSIIFALSMVYIIYASFTSSGSDIYSYLFPVVLVIGLLSLFLLILSLALLSLIPLFAMVGLVFSFKSGDKTGVVLNAMALVTSLGIITAYALLILIYVVLP